MKTITPNKTIKAAISENFFGIVDRLFDNTPRTVFAELIQNARRAGATRISFDFDEAGDYAGLQINVCDNGRGIQNMADLLHIRASGWDHGTMEKEDPAGMGFFCLCRMNRLQVSSRNSHVFMGENCEALRGLCEVPVNETPHYTEGVHLTFRWPHARHSVLKDALMEVSRYAPIAVYLDGRCLETTTFKPQRVIEEFEKDGVTVYIHRRSYHERLEFNFYGLLVTDEFEGGNISDYGASIDVKDTSKLQMVLPARNAIVRNEYYKELMAEVRRRIFKIIKADGGHALPYKNWVEAKALGVDLPPADAALRVWGVSGAVMVDTTRQCAIMNHANKRGEFETVAVAFEHSGKYALYMEDKLYTGYDWYDALPTVTHVEYLSANEQVVIEGTAAATNLEVVVTFNWKDDEAIRLDAPILIGKLAYGEDRYSRALARGKGFLVNPELKTSEDDICRMIDSAWAVSYLSDTNRADWHLQRMRDVRKCWMGAEDALEFSLRASLMATLNSTQDLINYAGTSITLQVGIDDNGESFVDRV